MPIKKKLSRFLTSLFFLVVMIAGVFWISAYEVKSAPSPTPNGSVVVSGYAWSDTIGWIKFDPSFGGVFYATSTRQLSGYAWSDTIGWIHFDGLSSYPDSSRGTIAKADSFGKFSGWIRACAGMNNITSYPINQTVPNNTCSGWSRTDGWDGWISLDNGLSSVDYGVSVDLDKLSPTYGDFSGYAWGSDVVGWVKFNCNDTPGECSNADRKYSDYKVRVIFPGVPLGVSCSADKSSAKIGDKVVFTADQDGGTGPYSYEWTGDWASGVLGTDVSTMTSFSVDGTKTATIKVTDGLSKTATSNCSVEIEKDVVIAPAYFIVPDYISIDEKDSFQFESFYNANKTSEKKDILKVTNLATWTSSDTTIATVVTSGSERGLVYCQKPSFDTVVITSTYEDENKKTLTDKADLNCDPVIPPNPEYTLTVKKIGKGYVYGGVDCGASCSEKYKEDARLSLLAMPDPDTFKSYSVKKQVNDVWLEDKCDKEYIDEETGDSACDLIMTSSKEVTVVFEVDPIAPTVKISANLSFAEIGDTATIEWESTNAVSCEPTLGDTGWINTARDNYDATGNPEPEKYDTEQFTELPITFAITCTSIDGKTATDSVTIAKKITLVDPSYNISPNHAPLAVNDTFQFTGLFNSDTKDDDSDIIDVTNLADWKSENSAIVSITTTGNSGRGKATCHSETDIDNPIIITSTYKYENIDYTDTATVACTQTDPPDQTLTVNIIGKGSLEGLISCDTGTCVKKINYGTNGFLLVSPDFGWTFDLSGWSGDCSVSKGNVFVSDGTDDFSDGDYVCDPLIMTSNKEVTVVFEVGPTYKISPQKITINVGQKTQFKGLYDPDGIGKAHYEQDKTDVADWVIFDSDGNIDDSIATFEEIGLNKGEAKCVSEGTAYIHSGYGGLKADAELICSQTILPFYTLTVNKTGDGNGEITGTVKCDANCDSASSDYPAGTEVEITATKLDGAVFDSWLLTDDCASFGKNSKCALTMTSDKNATASFSEDLTLLPVAYISADDTSVDANGKTKIHWKSDNATGCVNEGGDGDSGWLDANDNEGLTAGVYETTPPFESEEERNYAVTCYNNLEDESSASIDVSADNDVVPPPPIVDLFTFPDEVEVGGIAELSWLSMNIKTKSCNIKSDEDKILKDKDVSDEGSISTDSLDKELSEYAYTITCDGDDGSYAEDEVVVKTKAKTCQGNNCIGAITITASDIEATIVAGLSTNSNETDVLVSGTCQLGSLKIESSFDKSVGNANFNPGGLDSVSSEDVQYNGRFSVKKIKGNISAKTYPITLTATCINNETGEGMSATAEIDLIVKRIFSDWQEY